MNTRETLDVRMLPHTVLIRHPLQLRATHAADAIHAMADNIRTRLATGQIGIIEPLVVTPAPGDMFWVIAGQLRHAGAAALGENAPLLPCIVRVYDDDALLQAEMAAENGMRRDMRPSEWAAYVAHCLREGQTRMQVAAATGHDPKWVDQMRTLAALPERVRCLVDDGTLTLSSAALLIQLERREQQLELAEVAATQRLTATRIEQVIAKMQGGRADAHTAAARLSRVAPTVANEAAARAVLPALQAGCASCSAKPVRWRGGAPAVISLQKLLGEVCGSCEAQLPEVCKTCPLRVAAEKMATLMEPGHDKRK